MSAQMVYTDLFFWYRYVRVYLKLLGKRNGLFIDVLKK